MNFPAGKGAIISQFRVWPFPSTLIMTFGERNRKTQAIILQVCVCIIFFYLNDVQ
jgi:hypothetical protein